MATLVFRYYLRLFLIGFPFLAAAAFQCDLNDQKIFATAFQKYLSSYKITDPMNFDGYSKTVEKILEDEGWTGSEKICGLLNSLNAELKPIEDCIDTFFASEALNLHPNNSAMIRYFSNIKQWDYACNEGKDHFHSSFDCIRSNPRPHYCLNDHTSCFGMKQEFLCNLQFYREKCGESAAEVICSMQTVSFYGQNCLSIFDCKDLVSSSSAAASITAIGPKCKKDGGNETSIDIEHLRYVVAFWFTCRFALYWLDLN